ncbi:putative kinesin motor domain, P-loop containing nucleoside triphosphate hydrolase [Plasmopara halstedii]
MERAHVLIKLRCDATHSDTVGICRTSSTTICLEHSNMSPGVANITFEQVYDINDNNSRIFETSLKDTIDNIVHGKSATLVVTGAKSAGKSLACHGDRRKLNERKTNSGLITLAIQETFSILNEKANDLTRYNF